MATASGGRAARGCREAPARPARPCSATSSRSGGRAGGSETRGQKAELLRSKRKEADMNNLQLYTAEPRTAAELIARYQDVRRRLYAPNPCLRLTDGKTPTDRAPCKAITTIPEPSCLPEPWPHQTPSPSQTPAREASEPSRPEHLCQSPRSSGAIGACQSRRPVTNLSGVRLVTGWSLPRLGRFFKRDHTTVLHSLRETNKRSAVDPELRAYMLALSSPPPASSSPPISCSRQAP